MQTVNFHSESNLPFKARKDDGRNNQTELISITTELGSTNTYTGTINAPTRPITGPIKAVQSESSQTLKLKMSSKIHDEHTI